MMFENRYRVVRNDFAGYEAQVKLWWWPFWLQIDFSNTHYTFEEAKNYCLRHAQNVVLEISDDEMGGL